MGSRLSPPKKVFVTRNIHDKTLKKWPKTSWRGCPAIGVLGIDARKLGPYRSKLCMQTTYPDVGRSHYLKPHLKSVRFVSALCCLSFPKCTGCSTPMMAEEETGTDLLTHPQERNLSELVTMEDEPSYLDDQS